VPAPTTTPPPNSTIHHVRTVLGWSAVALWAAVIFAASAQPGTAVPGRFATLAHFAEYAVFGLLLVIALDPRRPVGHAVALAVLFASAYGVSDEVHQHFVPGRTPDVVDWGVDTIGALAGALLGVLLLRAVSRFSRRLAVEARQ